MQILVSRDWPGRSSLQEKVVKNVPEDEAVEALIELNKRMLEPNPKG